MNDDPRTDRELSTADVAAAAERVERRTDTGRVVDDREVDVQRGVDRDAEQTRVDGTPRPRS